MKYYYVARTHCNPAPSMHHCGPFNTMEEAKMSVNVEEVLEWASDAQVSVVYEIMEVDITNGQMEMHDFFDFDLCDLGDWEEDEEEGEE